MLVVAARAACAAQPEGAALYQTHCMACHGQEGRGVPGRVPPLAGSDLLRRDAPRAIGIVLAGSSGPLVVNGVRYAGVMPAFGSLDDADIAALLTWVRSAWSAGGGRGVTAPEVAAVRDRTRSLRATAGPSCRGAGCGHGGSHHGGRDGAGGCHGPGR
jgi:mono/diheme cytochrome c family protein